MTKSIHFQSQTMLLPPSDPCSICTEEFTTKSVVGLHQVNQTVQHVFHAKCIVNWVTTQLSGSHPSCPLCKLKITSMNEHPMAVVFAYYARDSLMQENANYAPKTKIDLSFSLPALMGLNRLAIYLLNKNGSQENKNINIVTSAALASLVTLRILKGVNNYKMPEIKQNAGGLSDKHQSLIKAAYKIYPEETLKILGIRPQDDSFTLSSVNGLNFINQIKTLCKDAREQPVEEKNSDALNLNETLKEYEEFYSALEIAKQYRRNAAKKALFDDIIIGGFAATLSWITAKALLKNK